MLLHVPLPHFHQRKHNTKMKPSLHDPIFRRSPLVEAWGLAHGTLCLMPYPIDLCLIVCLWPLLVVCT